jgi:hypothetical protein
MRFLVQAANGIGAVGLDTAEGDGYRVTPEGATDTAAVSLHTHATSTGSPLGVTAGVTDDQGMPVAGRTVRFTVSRSGQSLFTGSGTSGDAGSVEAPLPSGQKLPAGRITVKADLLDAQGGVKSSDSVETVIAGASIQGTPLTTRAGTAFAPLSATVTDARGPVPGVTVTFTFPSGSPGATFPNGAVRATAVTDSAGVAKVTATATARSAIGTFPLVLSTEGANDTSVPMAAQYGLTPFISPFSTGNPQTAVTSTTGTTPLKTTALLADGTRLSDAAAAALVSSGRVQVRWRIVGTATWITKPGLTRYDATMHFFQSDLKASTLGWVKGRTYSVSFRILPATTDLQPIGTPPQGAFDLGSREALVQVK